ncbi:glycerophosphodiester phosphodiesterase 1-like [Ptychodera flava]|uniref:glycerophosphodiester phosphodiesterase 1-like n=1 Tax=Ptychodera flava TaxID=63121 RepID=UPI00396A2278
MDSLSQLPVYSPLTSGITDACLVLCLTFLAWCLARPEASHTKCLFSSLGVVSVVFALIHGFRIPPVDQKIASSILEVAPNRATVIGHRAGACNAPENTIAAIREAKRNGADGVELDVHFTKDGVPVIIHDPSVDRTTDGQGMIRALTFEEVRKLNASYGHRFRAKFPDEHISTLEEVTEECLKLKLKIFFDVKVGSRLAATTFVELFEKFPGLYSSAMICSFFPNFIYMLRLGNPNIVTALIYLPGSLSYLASGSLPAYAIPRWTAPAAHVADILIGWAHRSWLWHLCGNSALLLHHSEVSRHEKLYWEQRGVRIIPWTVNNLQEKRFYEESLNVPYITDCVTADCPDSC